MAAKTFLKSSLTISLFLVVLSASATTHAKIIYVDDDAAGANNGSSWLDAFNCLQDALADANTSAKPVLIHIAQGIYKPDQGAGIAVGDRTATFQLINGLTIKGGYAGFGQPEPNARDISAYETILTGDLASNDIEVNYLSDLWDEPTLAENSYHVVTGSTADSTAILDGFTVTGGHANGSFPYSHGGGMYNYEGSPTLINCTFRSNSAVWDGGAIYTYGEVNEYTQVITNCMFSRNYANWAGGGMYNDESNPMLTNCAFRQNSAASGGGMCNSHGSNPVLINCMFSNNSALMVYVPYHFYGGNGGGMVNDSGSTILIDCTFTGNSAVRWGGAMFNEESNPTLTNCTLSGNSAPDGGGMYNYNSDEVALSNCILTGNKNSAIVAGEHTAFLTMTNCTFTGNDCAVDPGCYAIVTMTNCILWDGGNEICFYDPWVLTITHSDVQGGWWGNIDDDPCFADPGYWDANGVWIEGDYHLLPDSPCIDAGDPNYVAEPNETDLDGKPRVIAGRIDMGAYEYSLPIQADVRIVPRTINLASSGKWIAALLRLPEDYNAADMDTNSIFLENEIAPDRFSVDEQEQVALARFIRSEVQSILDIGEVELTITGRLTDGTVFEGTDTIKVIDKAEKK